MSRAPLSLKVRAFAKVNLDLRVLGTRPDGYHELRTVFQTIALHDTITIDVADGPLRLACDAAGVPADESNLVWRTARALWTALGRAGEPHGISVRIEKAIPLQAGLGGGSADAAAALTALGRLWGPVPPDVVRDVAGSLGADVPFFLTGGTALGLGRGEEIYPLVDMPPHAVVVVTPPFGVSTVEAYRWYDDDRAGGLKEAARDRQLLPVPWPSRAAQMINDLEPPVVRRHPEIGQLRSRLREAGAVAAAMSGSGSAVFGLFARRTVAVRAAAAMGGRSLVTRTLSRTEHERQARPAARRRN